jgi:hypothetical protein
VKVEKIMEEQRFQVLVKTLQEQEGIEEIFLLNKGGEVVYKSADFQLSNEEAGALLTAWKTKEPAIMFQNYRFAVLKNDEIQLAARNISGGKGNIVGSVTKEGEYLVAHTRDEGLIILEWSIFINKVAWS